MIEEELKPYIVKVKVWGEVYHVKAKSPEDAAWFFCSDVITNMPKREDIEVIEGEE